MRVAIMDVVALGGLEPATVEAADWEVLGACPICERTEALRDVVRVRDPEQEAAWVAVCTSCEHGFLRRRPGRAWFDAFYAQRWDRLGRARAKDGHIAVRPDTKVWKFCEPNLPAGARVLEVGAGFGSRLAAFRERGHEVSAIERSAHRAEFVRERLGIPCTHAAVEDASPMGPFDLVYLHHVLEHVSDAARVVSRLRGLLPEGGLLYIAVPDFWQEPPPQACHFVPHLSLFTMASLARLLHRSGFRVLRATVNLDIELLAVAGEAQPADPSPRESDFWDRMNEHVQRAFGGRPGEHALAWFKRPSGPTYYGSHVWHPGAARARLRLARAARHLPGRLREAVLPAWAAARKLRMLRVDVADERTLPVEVEHVNAGTALWVK